MQATPHLAWRIVHPMSEGGQVIAERNSYYWKVDPEGPQLPYLDRVAFLALNLTHRDPRLHEVFQNRDFRIGLSYAIERQETTNAVFQRQGEPWQARPLRESEFFDEELAKQYTEYSLDKANGFLDRGDTTKRTPTDTDFAAMANGSRSPSK